MGADGESQRTAHLCRWGFGFAAGKKVDFTNEMGGRGGEVERRTVSRSGRPICAAGDSVLRLGKK